VLQKRRHNERNKRGKNGQCFFVADIILLEGDSSWASKNETNTEYIPKARNKLGFGFSALTNINPSENTRKTASIRRK
jgi:hypothetical protein